MRIALAAVVASSMFAAALAFAADPKAPAGKAPKGAPSATPEATPAPEPAKPKDPGKGECQALVGGQAVATAKNGDYQGCLRDVSEQVRAKLCKESTPQVEFTFARGGQKPMAQAVSCKN